MAIKNEAKVGTYTVGGQPTDPELAGLYAQGYRTLVNVRMPEELDELEAPKAEAAGLKYVDIGFTIATLTPQTVDRIRTALEGVPEKVYIH